MLFISILIPTIWLLTTSHVTISLHQSRYFTSNDRLGGLDSYRIVWKTAPVERHLKYLDVDQDNLIKISTKDSEKYYCTIPDTNNLNFDNSAKNSSSSSEEEDSKKTKSPIELLEPLLSGNYCSYKFDSFWIYELCHGRYLRQYHEENSKYKAKLTQEYYLGRMDSEQIKAHNEEYLQGRESPRMEIKGHEKPYVRFNMTGGTKCDLTKKNRVSRIIYACNDEPSLELHSINEISTCEYEAIVLVPLLCHHSDFKTDVNVLHDINCYYVPRLGQPDAKSKKESKVAHEAS